MYAVLMKVTKKGRMDMLVRYWDNTATDTVFTQYCSCDLDQASVNDVHSKFKSS